MIARLIKNYRAFLKYSAVGAAGTLVDLISLYLFVEYFGISILPATTLSFLLSVSHNFILNKIWTFQSASKNYRKLFVKFLIVSVVGLGITLACMYALTNVLGMWYMIAKLLTSLIVLTWNFLGNKLWTFTIRERNISIPDSFLFDLSVVIPAFNEEYRIKNTLLIIHDFLENAQLKGEIIVVDDGSTDKMIDVVQRYQKKIPHLFLESYKKNQGKGHAVKLGVDKSKGRYILIADADNSTPIEEYFKLAQALRHKGADIAIGSRFLPQSDIKLRQPVYRVMLGRVGNFLIRLFLVDGVKDTQCGFKLFHHQAAKQIFAYQKVKRFGFDMEALVIAESFDYHVIEVPVDWFNSPDSRVRPVKDALITLKDLIYIKLNLLCGRYNSD